MSHEKTWLFDRQSTVRSLEKRHWNTLNRRRTSRQHRKVQFRCHWSSTRNRFWTKLERLFVTNKITIRITRIIITRTIIADKTRSINWEFTEKRKTINQTTILILSLWEQLKVTLYWTSKRSISWQMNLFWKIPLTEKITTINPAKIIHRVILSIDFCIFHTIIIIIIFIALWIIQVDCINQNRERSWKEACKSR